MTGRITVVVVDDHSLFRAGVIQSLALDAAIQVVGEGGSGAEAMELARTLSPDVVLLDISMPGDGGGSREGDHGPASRSESDHAYGLRGRR